MLDGFVREQNENIMGMCLTEFNEEIAIRGWKQDGAQQKAVEAARNALAMNLTAEQAAQITGLTLEQVLDLQKGMAAQPSPAN